MFWKQVRDVQGSVKWLLADARAVLVSLPTVDQVPVSGMSPMHVHRLLAGPSGSQVVSNHRQHKRCTPTTRSSLHSTPPNPPSQAILVSTGSERRSVSLVRTLSPLHPEAAGADFSRMTFGDKKGRGEMKDREAVGGHSAAALQRRQQQPESKAHAAQRGSSSIACAGSALARGFPARFKPYAPTNRCHHHTR